MGIPDIIGKKAKNTSPLCMRCPFCSKNCPTSAIKLIHQGNFCKALASAAFGVLSTFKKDKVSFVSFAKDITQYCDCAPNPGEITMKNIGVFGSNSPVSIDGAFHEMANYKIFNEAYHVDCMLQVEEAKRIGIEGDVKPEITRIN